MRRTYFAFKERYKNWVNILLLMAIIALYFHVFNLLTYRYISIEFKDLRPVHEKVSVFYKGHKVGYVYKMELSNVNKSTFVYVILTHKKMELPVNTKAVLKKEVIDGEKRDYLELYYPSKPSTAYVKNGAILEGSYTTDIETFMANQTPEDLESVRQNLAQSAVELENTLSALGDLLVLMQDVVKENESNISDSTYNLSKTTENLNQLTAKFDKAISQKMLNNAASNIQESLVSVKNATDNLDSLSANFNDVSVVVKNDTLPQIQSTLKQTESLVQNANEVTNSIGNVLDKPFGGFRFLFGRTVPSN